MRTIKTITGISLLILMGFTAPKNPELAAKLINKLFQAFDEYDKDIRDYRKVKQEVLSALTGSTI